MKTVTVEFTLNELENLIMMYGHCKRHFQHTYAQAAIRKVENARKELFPLLPLDTAGAIDGEVAEKLDI